VGHQVLDGAGWVDVALENDRRTIACEITITTSVEHEIANLQKCLAAGFAYVVLIATEPRHVTKLRAAAEAALPEPELARVRCLMPEGLIGFLVELAATEQTQEQLVGGFKVKTKFRALEPEQEANKADSISRAILNSLKRLDPRKRDG
jgi:hypothetical protein